MKCEICGEEKHFTVEPTYYVCDGCMEQELIEESRYDAEEIFSDECEVDLR